ncbi:sensor histidine kinase [Dyella subtropica]|uniref:sensor histidine kinase n=1 Tax=Dyella subtropica TaxID=2992127 RepID=UPI0022535FD9|nr:sensor histidine kinase [Dyella subtropica]
MAYPRGLLVLSAWWRLAGFTAACLCAPGLHAQEITRTPRVADSPLDRPLAELRHVNATGGDTTHGGITAIAQSPDGFLWLGSSVGLLRFDGVRFDDTYANRLPSLGINSLYVDANGDIWVGYFAGGLSRIRGNDIVNYQGGVDVPQGTLFTVVRGPDAHLWAASTKGVVRLVDDRWTKVGSDLGYEGGRPHSMQMIDGVLWIVDDTHAWFLKPGATKFDVTDSEQHISVQWRRTGTPPRTYNSDEDGPALVDSSEALWIGRPKGIERDRWTVGEDGQPKRTIETFSDADGLSGNGVQDIFEDREGSVWVITSRGLDQFRATNLRPLPLPGNVQVPFVVPAAGEQVWVPNVWQSPFLVTGVAAKLYAPIPNAISAAVRDKHGVVWMAGLHGVFKYENGTLSKIEWPPPLQHAGALSQAIAMDDQGVLWVSVALNGLYQFKDGSWTKIDTAEYGQSGPVRLLNDAYGRLWLAYPHEPLVVMAEGKTRRYGAEEGLEAGGLLAVEVTKLHVWAGGERGLFLLRGERFAKVKGKNGQVFRVISGIVELDNGDLWLNGLDGAYRIEASELARAQSDPSYEVSFRFFGTDDGRLGMADHARPLPTLAKSDDGRLWFSTSTSVSWISPEQIIHNTVAPTITMEGISDGEVRYPVSDAIRMRPLTRKVNIDYTAASMANPKRVQFRYRLDGVDNDWQNAGSLRNALYTNLGPGHYRFHVQAVNEDGVASAGDSSFAFAIRAAWYQTMIFKVLCAMAILAMLVATHRLRLRQERARIRLSIEARDDERDRIARDLHDTLLQSVQGLVMRFQSVADRINDDQHARVALEGALDRADKVVAEARGRVLDLRTRVRGDLHEVLKQTGVELTADQPVHFKALVEGRPRELTAVVYWEVLSIAKEAMFNAYQHSNGTLLEMEIAYLSSVLRVRLRDNGVGIPEAVLQEGRPNHWGISGMRERAEKISAKFRIWSREGEGCEIEVLVPAGAAYLTQVSVLQRMLERLLQWARG